MLGLVAVHKTQARVRPAEGRAGAVRWIGLAETDSRGAEGVRTGASTAVATGTIAGGGSATCVAAVAVAVAAAAGLWVGASTSLIMGSAGRPRCRTMVSLAVPVPSAPHVGQATRVGILPFTGSTSNA